MQSFCNQETLALRKKKSRRYFIVFAAMCLLTLLVFIAECLLTRTGNMAFMLRVSYVSMIVLGFSCIVFCCCVLLPSRRKETHLEGLLSRDPTILEGRFTLTDAAFRIPKSVRVRAISLETEEGTQALNLDEEWTGFAPPDGSLVRVRAARKFITGIEVLEAPALPDGRAARTAPRRRGFLRHLFSLLPALVLWTMLVLVFGGFIFNQITDTTPENKIVLYADCEIRNAPELAETLEKELDGTVRMVKIHPFTYAMFDTARISQGDLYLVPDSHRAEYRKWFAQDEGRTMYDPAGDTAVAEAYFLYVPEGASPEMYRLYLGSGSVHLEDGLAARAAELLLNLKTEKEETR